MATTPNLDKSNAQYSENLQSYKTKRAAEKNADDYAGTASVCVKGQEKPKHGEIFRSKHWNGGYNVPVWLCYDVSKTDEGFTITVYRWLRDEED